MKPLTRFQNARDQPFQALSFWHSMCVCLNRIINFSLSMKIIFISWLSMRDSSLRYSVIFFQIELNSFLLMKSQGESNFRGPEFLGMNLWIFWSFVCMCVVKKLNLIFSLSIQKIVNLHSRNNKDCLTFTLRGTFILN